MASSPETSSMANLLERNSDNTPKEGEMLEQRPASNRNTQSGGGPADDRRPAVWKHPAVVVIIAILMVIVIALAMALGVKKHTQSPPDHHVACHGPDGWFKSQGQFYYFSKARRNWTDSQSHCSSHNASLVMIDPQELHSLLPYKGKLDHWIGLRKDADHVWRWANGTEFNHQFHVQEGADCAYLDTELTVSSSSCSSLKTWICNKLDGPL